METTAVDAAARGPVLARPAAERQSSADAERIAQQPAHQLLDGEPTAYGFFQAIRLLLRASPAGEPIGGNAEPAREVVRLGVDPTLGFPPSELTSLTTRGDGPPRLGVAFMGLTGPSGVLPHHYTLLAAERARARDTSLRDFLDIFHHRLLSLFYLAWEKHRFPIARERGLEDALGRHLLDLVGLGTAGLRERLGVTPDALLGYAGLLAMRPRPAVALQQMLEDFFGVPAEVEQFVGGWYPLHSGGQCELGADDPGSTLGGGAVVGDEIWDEQSRVRIRLGPMPRETYEGFLPTGRAYQPLQALVRFFTSDAVDVEVRLVLDRLEVPACVLGASDDVAPPLGWSTWLPSAARAADPDDTILSLSDARIST